MALREPQALALFDIDGTLLRRAGPHHRQALIEAIRRVTGLETTTDGVPVSGMLDRDILAQMLARAGVSATLVRRHMPKIVAAAQRIYVRGCPDLRGKVCPGARGLLYRLSRRRIPAGLVRVAVRHARREGWIGRASPVALIGDHPDDIRAAHANGVRAIAVATGLVGAAELAGHRPDVLVEDMRALSFEMLFGGTLFG